MLLSKPQDLSLAIVEVYVKALVAIVENGHYPVWAYQTLRDHNDYDAPENWRETVFRIITSPLLRLTSEEVVWRALATQMLSTLSLKTDTRRIPL